MAAEVKATQFEFTAGHKKLFYGLMAVGLLSMILTWFLEPGRYPSELPTKYLHIQFWTNFFHNAYFFTGVSFAALLFIATHALAYGGWHSAFKRVPEAMVSFMIIGTGLLAIVLLTTVLDIHGLYLWNDKEAMATDKIVQHKTPFLSPLSYALALLAVIFWWFVGTKLRALSVEEDSKGFASNMVKTKFWAALFLPIAGFSSAYFIWQTMMSIDVHWYSTMFAWYNTAGFFVTAVCFMILILQHLKDRGYLPNVSKEHFHDLGKFAFGISVFWTYLWFDQYMLIWYANNGEETWYFNLRFEQFPFVFYLNIILNFVLPFAILIRNTSKRRRGILILAAGLIIFGHWIDMYQMVKPGVWHNMEHAYHHATATGHEQHGSIDNLHLNGDGSAVLTSHGEGQPPHEAEHEHSEHGLKSFYLGIHFPGLLEIGTFCFFLGLFLFWTFRTLASVSLVPVNDAYFGESSEHHANAYKIDD